MSPGKTRSEHYGLKAFRRSFLHFLLGKGFSSISTLVVLLIIIRELKVEEFAAYASFHALAFIIGLISSLGINPLLLRFLPELLTQNQQRSMYRLLTTGSLVRALLYVLTVLLLLPVVGDVAGLFNLEDWVWLMPIYFIVGFFRVNSTFFSQALESLLWQRDAQYSLAGGGLIKMFGTIGLMLWSDLTLINYTVVEVVSEAAGMLFLIIFAVRRWMNDKQRDQGDPDCLRTNRRRYINFAFWCYLQNATSILYGSAPNRLFASHFLTVEFVALFGVIDRLIDFIRRFEPLRMFLGMIRPVFMSRYTEDRNFDHLVFMANFLIRVNLILLLLPFVFLSTMGDVFFEWVTKGKYLSITALFLAFYFVVLLNSMNYVFDMLTKAVEKNRIISISNVVLSGSIVLAIPMVHYFGLWSIAIANIIGLVLSLYMIWVNLKRAGFVYHFEWKLASKVVFYMLLSVAIGYLLIYLKVPVYLSAVVACFGYIGLVYIKPPLNPEEMTLVRKLVSRKIKPA